ncbi:MAG TPA: hypothetical protein PKA77_17125 [Chitinophagaceae bacterium]|jgi:hypothetical protein|nr:hypothetical protein [Chitinophagaceae bacterium]
MKTKNLIVLFFLLCNATIYSQDSLLYKIEGYCGTTKLRDINSVYGEAAFTNKAAFFAGTLLRQFVFDYGQYYKKDKDVTIKNEKGEVITFGSFALILNFFDYNGWEFLEKIEEGNSYYLIFKKKIQ